MSVEYWHQQATGKVQRGNLQGAIEDLNKALAEAPNDFICLSDRANCYLRTNNYKLAIQDANSAINLGSRYPQTYFTRGMANFSLKNFESAIQDYENVIRIDSTFAEAYKHRGFAYYMLGNNSKLIDDFGKAANSDLAPMSVTGFCAVSRASSLAFSSRKWLVEKGARSELMHFVLQERLLRQKG
jgi:tetratricopeptide (TPR) repeat protein